MKKKLGRVEWARFHQEAEHLPGAFCSAGRPSPSTAAAVWDLLKLDDLDGLLPNARYGHAWDLACVAQQAVTVVTDLCIRAYQGRQIISQIRVVNALAERWSPTFQTVQRQCPGIASLRDVRIETAARVRRELLLAGINVTAIWRLLIVDGPKRGHTAFFHVGSLIPYVGRRVECVNPDILKAFEQIVDADPHYRRPGHHVHGILLASEPTPERQLRVRWAGEADYNMVTTGARSDALLQALEQTTLIFDVDAFKSDYAHYTRVLGRKLKRKSDPKGRHKIEQKLSQIERVYTQVRSMRGRVRIKSGFFRPINRRYHATHFFPEHVSGKYDRRLQDSPRARWFFGDAPADRPDVPLEMYGFDVRASQVQILAVLLGLRDLESLASNQAKSFNVYLAEEAWRAHTEGRLPLPAKFTSARQLVPLVKELRTKHLYNSKVRQIVRDNPDWTPNLPQYRKGADPAAYNQAVAEATKHVEDFLGGLDWYDGVRAWFLACQRIARRCREKTPYAGAEFIDPFDGVSFSINPPRRATYQMRSGGLEMRLSVPGYLRREFPKFPTWFAPPDAIVQPRRKFHRLERDPVTGHYPVSGRKLGQTLAPLLIHVLDAYYAALVAEQMAPLFMAGVVFIVHDAFYLAPHASHNPVEFLAMFRGLLAGVGGPWLVGLGPVYDRLVHYLGDDQGEISPGKTYAQWAHDLRDQWKARVDREDWPLFAMGGIFPGTSD